MTTIRKLIVLVLLGTSCWGQTFDPAKRQATGTIKHVKYTVGDIDDKGMFEARVRMTCWGEDSIEFAMPGISGQAATVGKRVVIPWSGRGSMEWVEDGDALRWKMKFPTKPPTNTYQMQLSGVGFDFNYQTPANSPQYGMENDVEYVYWTDKQGIANSRPRSLDGGYAVKHKTKRNHIKGQTNYMTGKVMNIHRPKCTDALGVVSWATLEISNGTSKVTIDQTYLDNAQYPVVVNDTFGITAVGGTNAGVGADWLSGADGTPIGGNGTVDSVTVYNNTSGGTSFTAGIFAMVKNPSDLIDNQSTAEGTLVANDWATAAFGTGPAVVDSTTYLVSVHVGGNWTFVYDGQAGAGSYDNDETYSAGTMPDAFNWDSINYGRDISIYATYTPAGGAEVGQVIMISN